MQAKPPSRVSLLGHPFRIRMVPERSLPDAMGDCDKDAGLIQCRTGQGPTQTADTVLHEVFHGILHCQGREDGGKAEETYVRALATGLVGVLRDNPEFGKWLLHTVNQTSK